MGRIVRILTLILAGEIIFSLPFHTARFFRPTLLESFQLSNTQLGDVFAVYGVTAMLSYFPGGVLADRFPARKLMSVSLLATAAGGVYMMTIPGVRGLAVLYGYWGITSILLFWAALISATRKWGGHASQGKAFGILDGGRGLMAAVLALIAVEILAEFLVPGAGSREAASREEGFRQVIGFYSAVTAIAGVITWCAFADDQPTSGSSRPPGLSDVARLMKQPLVWAQAAIVVCAYSCYKGLDNYSLYGVQVLGMDEVESARLTAWATYLRPVAAIAAGFIADRLSTGRTLAGAFLVLLAVYAFIAAWSPDTGTRVVLMGSIGVSFFAVFALRGIYFALLEATRTPAHLTGATVGLVSFIGFTPEIFFSPVTGRILDANPGLVGHQHYFLFLAATALAGALTALLLMRKLRKEAAYR